jgi:hypothetical protein
MKGKIIFVLFLVHAFVYAQDIKSPVFHYLGKDVLQSVDLPGQQHEIITCS